MIKEIHSNLELLKTSLSEIDSAKTHYKEAGEKILTLFQKSQDLFIKHQDLIDSLDKSSKEIEGIKAHHLSDFEKELKQKGKTLSDSFKKELTEIEDDYKSRSNQILGKIDSTSQNLIMLRDKVMTLTSSLNDAKIPQNLESIEATGKRNSLKISRINVFTIALLVLQILTLILVGYSAFSS